MAPSTDDGVTVVRFEWRRYIAEPILFFLFVSFGFRMLAGQQILQDKICLNDHHLSVEYCRNISHERNDDTKLQVLEDYQVISTYRTLLQFAVSNLIPLYLFIGGFCDSYPNGRRVALLAIILDGLLQTVLAIVNNMKMLWSPWVFVITSLSPVHDYTAITIINSYIIVNTTPEERVSRMMFISVIFLLALAFGLFFTGIILNTYMPWVQMLAPLQIHNTLLPLLIGFFFQFCGFMWTYIFIKEQPVSRDADDSENIVSPEDDKPETATSREKSTLRKVFDLKLVKECLRTMSKKRPDNLRRYLYLVIAVQSLVTFTQLGPINNMLPIMQMLYKWDPSVFSQYMTVSLLWKPMATLITLPLVTKVFKLSDLQIAFFGCICVFLGHLSIGTVVRPAGYFLNMLLGASSVCASTGLKSYISKKIPVVEITKIFFAIQLVESLIPPAGSIVYTAIVSVSKKVYPTACFHFSAFIVLIAMVIIVYIDVSTIPLEMMREKEKESKDTETTQEEADVSDSKRSESLS